HEHRRNHVCRGKRIDRGARVHEVFFAVQHDEDRVAVAPGVVIRRTMHLIGPRLAHAPRPNPELLAGPAGLARRRACEAGPPQHHQQSEQQTSAHDSPGTASGEDYRGYGPNREQSGLARSSTILEITRIDSLEGSWPVRGTTKKALLGARMLSK